jgi:CheY-like chemotaxis protein
MDLNMPDMDGWQTTRRIRENHSAAGAPIIIMVSAHGREALVERLRDEPSILDGFIVKPATASMLFDAVADAKSGEAGVNARTLQQPGSNRLRGLKLLVVEDNLMNQQVAFELLSHEGADVTVASNGRLGVEAALAAIPCFDAVLMDIQMPDIDGRTATALIRKHVSMRSLPIIAMTANAMAEDKAACLEAGMNDHVGKPIDLDLLVATILQHCGRIAPADAAATNGAPPAGSATNAAPGAESSSCVADARQRFNEALHRVGENRGLFVDMAKLFRRSCVTLAADLQRFMLRRDKAGAAALLHTLRGTAGTVGAVELVHYAERLEQQLLGAGEGVWGAFSAEEFDALIRQTCNELRIFAVTLSGDSPSGIMARAVLNKPLLAGLLDRLDGLMRQKNMQATQVFDELRATCGIALGDRLTGLEDAMNDLNFPLSLERTRILRESLS